MSDKEKQEKPEHHKTLIVRITETLPIKDADKVELVKFGLPYQAVSQKGTFKVGDLAVYVQPDSVVPTTEPFKFIWEPYIIGYNVADQPLVPEKRRRITVKKLRGEYSEGLLLPITDFQGYVYAENPYWEEGSDVSDLIGVTHYQPSEEEGQSGDKPVRKHKRPKTVKGWFFFLLHKLYIRRHDKFLLATESVDGSYPKYDVSALKAVSRTPFEHLEPVVITEKIHGSSARYVFLDDKMYVGSRNLWLAPEANGYARAALKANPSIEKWCREHEGFALYGEVTPTQKGFDYGSKIHQFWLFDIRSPEGKWLDAEDPLFAGIWEDGIKSVPEVWWGQCGTFDLDQMGLIDGKTFTAGDHIREGVVIKSRKEREVRRGQRAQFKIVSNKFLERDGKQ